MAERLEISLKDGPVIIKGHSGAEISRRYEVWNNVSAGEYYPATKGDGGAFYFVTVYKEIGDVTGVTSALDELTDALSKIAASWIFSGGTHLVLKRHQIITSPRFETNNDTVCRTLLARLGQAQVRPVTASAHLEIIATYSDAPLKRAIKIAKLMNTDSFANRLVGTYDDAAHQSPGSAVWALHIYKVLDLIKKRYGSRHRAEDTVAIEREDWSRFERLLNTRYLRHAEIGHTAPLTSPEINWLTAKAHTWVVSYLRQSGADPV